MSSRSINKVQILGNLTRDPELKYTPNNIAVCTFGVATNRSWTTTEGQTKEETHYHRVVAWKKLAENSAKLLTKGRKIYLEGRITYREFIDKTGQQRNIAEIVMDDFIIFSDGARANIAETEIKPNTQTPDTQPAKASSYENNEDVNPDDIPF
jgi:single-strand DNA-binding protein